MVQTIKVFMSTPKGLVWTGYVIARKIVILPFLRELKATNPETTFIVAECEETYEQIDGRTRQVTTIKRLLVKTNELA